jgi:hypothetical protein
MNLKPFLSWCVSHGISTPLEVKVRPSDGYRYTVIKGDTGRNGDKVNVNLLQCPLDACITASSSTELADRLSFEASLGAASKYAPYIDTLPYQSAFRNLPRFWSPERLELVAVADGGFLQRSVAADQPRVSSVSDPWALACVDSRANFLPDMSYSMTPILDLINHDSTVKTSARVTEGDLFLDVATESIVDEPAIFGLFRSEPEVRMSYGQLTNLQTLLNYGFVQPENPFNTESILVNVVRQPPCMAEVRSDGTIEPISLGMLRRYLATSEELETAPSVPLVLLSRRNEVEVYALIACFLEESIYEAKRGVDASKDDSLVLNYLVGRVHTLQKGLARIQQEYPDVFEY